MDNKYTGEAELQIDGVKFTLQYDWKAIAQIQTTHGQSILKELFKGISPAVIADLLLIGMKKHHPDMTLEKIFDLSPPIIPTVQAIDKAIAYAYFGADLDNLAELSEDNQISEDDKKKTS